ncbi:MAG: hypothetical protein O3C60_19735 [Planctomycetota bacterium]|nr:hypothetical protein [Planctomycetota bacterium]
MMWIVAQDKSIKTEVSHYFVDPLGNHPIGRPSKSSSRGSMIETSASGSVPDAEGVAAGRGRHTNSDEKRDSQATKMLGNWLRTDDEQLDYWIEKAQTTRKAVVKKSTIVTSQSEIDEEAARKLASDMKNEVESKIPKECEGNLQGYAHRIATACQMAGSGRRHYDLLNDFELHEVTLNDLDVQSAGCTFAVPRVINEHGDFRSGIDA